MGEELSRSAKRRGELWSAAGDDWAELLAPTVSSIWGPVLDLARVTRGSRVLDVGCGSGDVLAQAQLRGATVSGVDLADSLLEIASDRLPEADLRLGDMMTLPFEDDAFDAVVSLNSLMFAGDPVEALREARRVLTPDGRLAVALWAEEEINEFRHVVRALVSVLPEPPAGDGPFALSEPGVLEEVISEAGFEPFETRCVPTPFTFVDREHYLGAVLGMAPGQSVLRQVDEEAVIEALLEAGEEFRRDDGSYRLENTFQAVGAIPRVE
ncbi:class I SAM-dependent methyltransferase [Natronorubrum halophilum]|uniref:class I SAM-dependent methyltransferase n=1 Tax=Natronorubrum halophilum TaxID=1702106 RepID=UPI000EF6601A|nr:class I SAM-dependent methyltransferase [Natronorubrum halophilum]